MQKRLAVSKPLPEAAMGPSFFARVLGAMLFFQAGCSLSAPAATTNSSVNSGRLIEGRALYEAQVNFGGARENDLGPGFDFGVPFHSKRPNGADPANMFR
jgi:hypothetical protein